MAKFGIFNVVTGLWLDTADQWQSRHISSERLGTAVALRVWDDQDDAHRFLTTHDLGSPWDQARDEEMIQVREHGKLAMLGNNRVEYFSAYGEASLSITTATPAQINEDTHVELGFDPSWRVGVLAVIRKDGEIIWEHPEWKALQDHYLRPLSGSASYSFSHEERG